MRTSVGLGVAIISFALSVNGLSGSGNILGGGGGSSGSNGVAASGYYGNNSAAIAQLKANAADTLSRTTQAIQAAQAMQQAARNLSLQGPTTVPNGLTVGGLQVATGAHAGWQGANLPVQSVANGQVTVTIQQTAPQALLNWQTFNLGKNTTAYFNQSAGGSSANTWVALNQIWDSSPSQIFGSIKAQGQVYLINQNGILFVGSSQVNVGSLVAAATTTPAAQFQNGLYQTYVAGRGSIVVQPGAQIATNAPQTTTSGGGFVIFLADSVTNAGSITTPDGQTLMVAGKSFLLRQGYSVGPSSSTQNTTSTTVGTEAEVTKGGEVTNSGLIESTTGDITMLGGQVTQAGIAIATTSVAKRGTIHLLTDASDLTTSVTLAPGSVTLIEPDANSGLALDPQRANAYTQETAYFGLPSLLNDEVGLPDQIGLSRIEITTGGTVNFATNSLTSATAGQIEVSAAKKIFVASWAELNVSGLVGVTLPMSANDLAVNIQGYELRDDPLNRDTKTLFNQTVWVNVNQLVEVPASSADSQNRFYTAGGVFEVSGELNDVQHSIDEWSAVGGSIVLSAPRVVAQAGSVFDIAGGTINYQSGYLKQSWLIGDDGRLYNANTAPAYMGYTGVFNGFDVNHPRWNVVETYQDVIFAPAQIYEAGYTVGRDAGTLTIDAPTALFAGTIEAGTYAGSQQNASRPSTVGDPFLLPQDVVPLNGSLVVAPYANFTLSNGSWVSNPLPPNTNNVVFTGETVSTPDSVNTPLPADVRNTDVFSAQKINAAQLGGLTVDIQAPSPSTSTTAAINSTSGATASGKGHLTIDAPLIFAPGAQITLMAAQIDLAAGIVTRGGDISVTSDTYPIVGNGSVPSPVSGIGIDLAAGAVIDTRGLWTNAELDPYDLGGEAYVNGGSISLVSDRGLILGKGSLIDASSGGELSQTRKSSGGAGGNITIEGDLATNAADQVVNSPVRLNGTLRSYGVTHGGTLTLQGHSFLIANQPTGLRKNQIWIAPSFFGQGFSSYTLIGLTGVTVAPGTQITVTEPVYQLTSLNLSAPTGANPSAAFGSPLLMPVYLPDPAKDTFTQRPGASLTLEAGVNSVSRKTASGRGISGVTVGSITMGTGAAITVDPGQSVILAGNGQITVNGTITAPSGSILIGNTRSLGGGEATFNVGALSIWIGSNSKLSVSGQATTAVDTFGRVFGFVTGAGSIFLGGFGTPDTPTFGADFGEAPYLALAPNLPVTASEEAPTDAFIIVRPGAQLNAVGTAALVDTDLLPGSLLAGNTVLTNSSLTPIASNGGAITFDSFTSIFLDGSMNARGGGNGASGGSLAIALFAPHYDTGTWNNLPFDMIDPATLNPIYGSDPARTNYLVPDRMRQLRIITVGSDPQSSGLSANLQPGELDPKLIAGKAYVSTQMLVSAGFANLTLTGGDGVVFQGNVTLRMPESINLSAAVLADTKVKGQVSIFAPYVLLNAIGGGNSLAGSLASGLGTVYGTAPLGPKHSSSFYRASLTVDADLIDLESTQFNEGSQLQAFSDTPETAVLQFGASVSYTVANGSTATVNYPTFPQITLVSQGDIRFLAGSTGAGTLSAPGNLTLIAAQIYPTTGAAWLVEAGAGQFPPPNQSYYVPNTSITIGRINAQTPVVPDSLFGELTFQAATINQGGVIRAPLGDLTFQEGLILEPNGQTISSNSGLNFLPGSITSVSANGLTMQYGGTTNGSVYTVNGNAITLYNPLTGLPSGSVINPASVSQSFQLGIHINTTGAALVVDQGALLDLSGGGNLTGAGFIPGEGGSVDILSTPLVNANPILNSFSSSTDTVYAIVPGFQGYSPVAGGTSTAYSGGVPSVGQQITLSSGIQGLAAGTYTLLPANYALLPGAFRVELGRNSPFTQEPVVSVGNGSYLVQSYSALANTGYHGTTPIQTIITPGTEVRDYSDYDEESYSSFVISRAQQYSQPRAMIPADAKMLGLYFGVPNSPSLAMQFQGTTNFAPASDGISGWLYVNGANNIEILGPRSGPTSGWTGISVAAADIDAVGAPNVFVGGFLDPLSGFIVAFAGGQSSIVLRTGAVLTGAQVDLISSNLITIEAGAGIDTLGRGAPYVDSSQGYLFTNSIPVTGALPTLSSVVVASNGYVDLATGTASVNGNTGVDIEVDSGALLYSEGTIGFATPGNLALGTGVNYGARYLDFSVQSVNIGSASALNSAQAQGTLPAGLILTQALLSDLLRGNSAVGAPALQMLTLAASQSINFYGSVDLSTINPVTGKSSLQELVLDTPAVYGAGASGDTATITTGTLVWNGLGQVVIPANAPGGATVITDMPPGPVIANGPGTGSGTLNIVANQIIFGYAPTDQSQNNTALSRLALGFSTVNLTATQEITANNKGTFSVYQTQTGASYSGGNLNLMTPLLTGDPGSVMNYKVGGALTLSSPAGISPATTMPDSLGVEINLSASSISDSTSIMAGTGKVTLTAIGDINLLSGSQINVSGQIVPMFDQNVATWGGNVALESTQGSVIQSAGSVINVSAIGNDAGALNITATSGQAQLAGILLGSTTGNFKAGSFDLGAQTIGDFVALNALLDTGGFYYSRIFDIKQGDLTIAAGSTIRAHDVEISIDNGSLTVAGTIDASGATPGIIRLSAGNNLELTSTAVLDVHNSVLQVDSYGQPIDAENRGTIELTVADGTDTSTATLNNGQGNLLLDAGATINMTSPDGVARGDLELNVPRTGETSGDIRISAPGPLNISGAQTIALNAFWTYAPTDPNGTIVQSAGSGVPQGAIILDQLNIESIEFINAAERNTALLSKITGLTAYGANFHLRPGVEIVSATPNGNLTIEGDIDLSRYRYGPNADVNPNSPGYGAGEPGVLVIRAGGNLNIYGSITDGFRQPPGVVGTTAGSGDDNGWVLYQGATTQNIVVPTQVILGVGTSYAPEDVALNYTLNNLTATVGIAYVT
ncbi:MAG: filamentous hemagglutinin N-terminal domain-containing protein, partial [Verrucomicrobia bacterium]|nr:filamentous hemagglutinin N-terminal domain-containing protein [Verrucomicrobiota bacterium]